MTALASRPWWEWAYFLVFLPFWAGAVAILARRAIRKRPSTARTFHGGASKADREAEDKADRKRLGGLWRTLHLIHAGKPFLRRWGPDFKLFGVYVHRIDAADPGKDLHDHPWPFVSIVLRGSYVDEVAHIRLAPGFAELAELQEERFADGKHCARGEFRVRRRWSIARTGLHQAHRIVSAEPGTVTLLIRGRKRQPWGFYQPDGWFDQRDYDFETRRPVNEERP